MPSAFRYVAAFLAAQLALVGTVLAEPAPLDVYGGLPGVETMAISPTSQRLAIVAQVAGERRLIVLQPDGELLNSAALGDVKLRGLSWIGDDQVLMVTSRTEALPLEFTATKHEFSSALVIPANNGEIIRIFGKRASMSPAVFGNYGSRLIAGKWQAYFGGIEFKPSSDRTGYEFDHGRPALFSVDVASNRPRKIAPAAGESHDRDWLIDARGTVGAMLDISGTDGRWRINNEVGATIASGVDKTGDVGLVSFGKDGTTLIYSQEDDAAGVIRWFEIPLSGGQPREVFADIRIERIYVDQTNGRLLGYLEGGPSLKPTLFDPAKQAIVNKVYRAFAKLNLEVVEWTPSFSHFLVHTSGNGDSGTWYVVDVSKLRANPVGNDFPRIPADAVGPISTVSYKTADGLELDGILTLPPGKEAKNLPVILFPHGGPHAADEARFEWWSQAFASRGYAVFQPNFRGSTNRSDAFRRAGYGQWGRKMQTDVSEGLAELARLGIADPKRACIMGASYGGYAALAGVTLQQGLYRCAIAVAPVSDLADMYWTDYRESGSSQMVKRSLRESLGPPAGFNAVSPRRLAARADAPILLIHGKDDTVVPFKQSTAMADALKDAGKPYELVTLREEDHWLSRSATRKQMLEAAMRFVQQHNPAN